MRFFRQAGGRRPEDLLTARELDCGELTLATPSKEFRKKLLSALMAERGWSSEAKAEAHLKRKARALGLFEQRKGQDVLLLMMLVQETTDEEPGKPGERRAGEFVYLCYVEIDRDHYSGGLENPPGAAPAAAEQTRRLQGRLRQASTEAMLVGYFDWAALQKFAKAYIWSQPPLKGAFWAAFYELLGR